MPRKKKVVETIIVELNTVEKEYIKLSLAEVYRTQGRINEEDFERLASKLDKPLDQVRNFANGLPDIVAPEQPKPKPEKKLTHSQQFVRNTMAQKTASGRNGITIMSDAVGAQIEDSMRNNRNPKSTTRDDCVYRGN
jgi:hypothetical protein